VPTKRYLARLLRRDAPAAPSEERRSQQAGQVLPIFVILSVVLLGGAALLTDVAWWWTVEQRMQRAADAAALAGAVYLPGNQAQAYSAAYAEATRNGFTHGADGVAVTPRRDPSDPRKLIVDIDGDAATNFAGIFCWDGGPCLDRVDVGVTGAAVFVLPVPMGSPQNYYGVGYFVDAEITTSSGSTAWLPASSTRGTLSAQWSNHGNVYVDDGSRAATSTNGAAQDWGDFNISLPAGATTTGIEVRLNSSINTAGSECRFAVDLYNGGSYTTVGRQTAPLTTNNPATGQVDTDHDVGSSTDMFGHADWTATELSNTSFRVRVRFDRPASCGATGRLDLLAVRIHYAASSTTIGPEPVVSPEGDVLAPQNFWGALQSKGAPNIQGDAYMTYYDTRTSATNHQYLPESFYHYAIEIPPGASGGEVWLFDPGFCDVTTSRGVGENWTVGGANGYSSRQPISTFYNLYDMNDTPYYFGDDTLMASSGDTFGGLTLADHTLNTNSWAQSMTNCRTSTNWHNQWWRLAGGLPGGRTYRLHTHSDDPNRNQLNATALNAFAIWSTASGGTPRVYGLGAMEAYVRLPGGSASEFYLSQIASEHAGKTMVISLWDPGDTGSLAANLQILQPTATDYQVTPFNYSARRVSGAASNCANNSGTDVTSVTTNTGGTSLYNGCWLDIEIPLPNTYSAPLPSSDTVATEGGWWKIRYNMSGSTSSFSTDLTTWQVELRGNPVHLVQP
jgi:hypothetical protein